MENNAEIQLVVKPQIVHKLQDLGANVVKRLQDLNIENLVATEDTVKSLKNLRAELNKELETFEGQRKLVKSGVLDPYNEFEKLYKTEVSDRYAVAINTLKDKIALVETKIKEEKEANVKLYFIELCQSENIDFLVFGNVGLEINLSTTEKAYKEKCNEFIKRVIDDLNLIKTTEFEAEVLTEYKKTLNASQAITSVKTRKEQERQESERLKQIEITRRVIILGKIGFNFDDFTKSYIYNEGIFISHDSVKDLSKEEFANKVIEFEEKIKALPKEQSIVSNPEPSQPGNLFEQKTPAPVLSAPVIETKEEIVTASFEVSGTMAQLKALGQYMKSNNINYKNI